MTRALVNPLAILLAAMSIQWVFLASAGSFSIKLHYVALALVIGYAATSAQKIGACLLIIRRNASWILPFLLYLLLMAGVLYGSPGQDLVVKQLFYFGGFVAFGGSIAMIPNRRAVLRVGGAMAIISFIVVVEIMARKIGLSWIDAIRQFVTSGDLRFVTFTFFRGVFRSIDTGDAEAAAALTNAIGVCVLISGLLFRSATTRPSRDIVGMGLLAIVVALLFLLNCRSALLVAGASMLLAIALRSFSKPTNLPILGLKALAAILILVVAVGFSGPDPMSQTVSGNFEFNDTSSEARLAQYKIALDRIAANPLTGSGYYQVDGLPIHNLFLNTWSTGGIVPFLFVLCFYLILVGRWFSFVMTIFRRPEEWVLPLAPEWVACLPLCPLFRVWLSGAGGNVFLGEWIAIGAFFGLGLANHLARNSVRQGYDARVHEMRLQSAQRRLRSMRPSRSLGR